MGNNIKAQELTEFLEQHFIIVAKNGVDLNRIKTVKLIADKLEAFVKVNLGELQEENRKLRELVEGFAQLDETYPDFRSIAGFIVKAKSALKG